MTNAFMELRPYVETKEHHVPTSEIKVLLKTHAVGVRKSPENAQTTESLIALFEGVPDGNVIFHVEQYPETTDRQTGKIHPEDWTLQGLSFLQSDDTAAALHKLKSISGCEIAKRHGKPVYDAFFD